MTSPRVLPTLTRSHRRVIHLRLPAAVSGSRIQVLVAGIVGVVIGLFAGFVSDVSPKWLPFIVAGAVFPFVCLVVQNVEKLLLGIIIFDMSLGLNVYFGYRESVGRYGALGGLNISVTTLALIVLYALWFLRSAANKSNLPYPRSIGSILHQSLPVVPYLFFVMLSGLVAADTELSFFTVFLFIQMILMYIYILYSVRTRRDVRVILLMLLGSFIFQVIVMLLSAYMGTTIDLQVLKTSAQQGTGETATVSRIAGTFGSPNAAGGYLALLLAPLICVLLTREKVWYKVLGGMAFFAGSIALFLTLSRGGWIAFVLSLIILCAAAWYRGWLSIKVPLAIILTAFAVMLLLQGTLWDRLSGDDAGSFSSRIPLMNLALEMIEDHPLLGVGTNNYAFVMNDYTSPRFSGDWIAIVHNNYLLIWAETGIGGLLTFLVFMLATLYRGWRCWQARDRFLSSVALALSTAILGHMVHMNFDFFTLPNLVQLLWFSAALISAMHLMVREGKAELPKSNTASN